eukprot:CAMPEP_0196595228 /NCGR_PEP_ID=MMETSP1081-20130531/80525_1 /TAXON_ID=36882 /ORGANISM="Pyramimonas amylifera, Strain CCMP720" /LENGTH=37 /DNA_ID= /DNA_START= /DNA_END= /DNA_ORIENTATION=
MTGNNCFLALLHFAQALDDLGHCLVDYNTALSVPPEG